MYVAVSQIVCRAVAMLVAVVLARKLTVSDYGVYNLYIGAILIFSFFTNLGMAGSLQRFLSEYAKLEKIGPFFNTFFFAITYRTISGLAVFTIAVLMFDQFAGYFSITEYKNAFILFCFGTYALFQIDFLQVALNSLFLHAYSNVGQLLYQIVRAATIIFMLMFLAGGIEEVFVGEIIGYGFGAILFWYIFFHKVYIPKQKLLHKDSKGIEWRRFLRFSAYNAATIPGGFLFNRAMDYFVVAAMAAPNQLGIYALGARASAMLLSVMPQSLLQTVIRPVFYHHYYSVKEKNLELNRMFRSLVVLIAAILFPVLALVSLQAESILTFVFNSKFAESTPIFLIFLFFSVFTVLELPSDLVLQAIEKVEVRLYAQIFAIYNLVAALLLMPQIGIIGVAFATGSALMGKCLFWYFMARYYTGISICWGALLKISINTAIAAGITYWIGTQGDSNFWMFAAMTIGFIVYIIMSSINHFLDNHEKNLVNRYCKRQVFKV